MFADASDLYWGYFPTQVSPKDFASGAAVEIIRNEPVEWFSGQFKGSQPRVLTVDKDVFAIVSGCRTGE